MKQLPYFLAAMTALPGILHANEPSPGKVTVTYSEAKGIGREDGVMRRDPSDIIKVGGSYYVWYSKGPKSSGCDATVWFATSSDGHEWSEEGEALGKGPAGNWDEASVFTPNILVAEGKYWFYYKGRPLGKSPADTRMGVAIADKPEGPYIKHEGNPVIPGKHEVVVWPQGKGVVAMIGTTGPPELTKTIQYSGDGIHFTKTNDVVKVPHAGGTYRPEAFTDSGQGKMPEWGVHIGKAAKSLPFIERFDIEKLP